MTETQPTLAGLDFDLTDTRDNHLRAAVIRTLQALDDEDLLEPVHAAHAQLALELADAIARSRGKASAAAMASAQLMAALDALPKPSKLSTEDALDRWLNLELAEHERAG